MAEAAAAMSGGTAIATAATAAQQPHLRGSTKAVQLGDSAGLRTKSFWWLWKWNETNI